MDMRFWQQMVVFAAVFMLLLVGMEWLRGLPITGPVLLAAAGTTLIATPIYGVITLWLNKRKKRGE